MASFRNLLASFFFMILVVVGAGGPVEGSNPVPESQGSRPYVLGGPGSCQAGPGNPDGPPHPRGPDPRPVPIPVPNPGSSSSSSSSSSLESPAFAPEISPASAPEISPASAPEVSPASTQEISPAEPEISPAPANPGETRANSSTPAAGAPSAPHSLPKVLIKGQVVCLRCSTPSHHKAPYDDELRTKREGISGATVELDCPELSADTTTSNSGHFSLTLRRGQAPQDFPHRCTVFVVTSTLPGNCSSPVANNAITPSLEKSSDKSLTYTVPDFEFSPKECN